MGRQGSVYNEIRIRNPNPSSLLAVFTYKLVLVKIFILFWQLYTSIYITKVLLLGYYALDN
jgi:hypothetical protein